MTADKFSPEAFDRDIVSEALRESWHVFDKLGAHQSDEQRIAVIHSPEFASAAFRVRTAMLRVARQI